jgi:hypothetical protein
MTLPDQARREQSCGTCECCAAWRSTCEGLQAQLLTREQELAHWKICENCGEPLTGPGICDRAISEHEKGLEQMHEEALTRAEAAEARLLAVEQELTRTRGLVRLCSAHPGTVHETCPYCTIALYKEQHQTSLENEAIDAQNNPPY